MDEPAGPLPNGFPACFCASVSRPTGGQPPLPVLVDLLRATAVTFDAACGYLTADTTGMLGTYAVRASPYESRSGAHTYPHRRLTDITRGVHWGNVVGSGHLAGVGGAAAVREHFHRVEPIDGSDLWWLQLTPDPDVDHADVDRAAWAMRAVMPRLANGNLGLTQGTDAPVEPGRT